MVQHISVTADFVEKVKNIIKNNIKDNQIETSNDNTLRAALYSIGFQIEDREGKQKKITMLKNVNIRCKEYPYMYRKASVYVGDMRFNFPHSRMYEKGEVLDVDTIDLYEDKHLTFVGSLPYDLPVIEKINTRKYTKRNDLINHTEILFENPKKSEIEDNICLGGK